MGETDPRLILSPSADAEIRALAASPSGDRVAAVLVTAADGGESAALVVLGADGAELRRVDGIEQALGESPEARVRSLDWSPQGEYLLIAFDPGGLVAMPVAGAEAPTVLGDSGVVSEPLDAKWSPTGEDVGFLTDGGGAPTNLYLVGVGPTPSPPRPLLPEGTPDRTIGNWAWLPDGRSLIFTEGGGATASADLWRIAEDGTDRRLIASAGSAAPVARVAEVMPSPDGRAVAYTVVVPDESGPRFHSLWVREVAGGRGFQIAVPTPEAVTDLWWTAGGLIFRTVPTVAFAGEYRGGPFALYQSDSGPEAARIVAVDDGAASPVAAELSRPPATPEASPVSS